jgi:hypothetical protein
MAAGESIPLVETKQGDGVQEETFFHNAPGMITRRVGNAEPRPLFQALARVKKALPPIEKRGDHDFFHYAYTKIADIYNALRPLMAAECVTEIPQVLKHETSPAKTSGEKDTTRHYVEVAWTFIHGESGDFQVITMPGESLDKEDKGLQKAISASHKALLTAMFEIGGEDPEGGTQNRQPSRQTPPPKQNHQDASEKKETVVGLISDVAWVAKGKGGYTSLKIDGAQAVCFHPPNGPSFDELKDCSGRQCRLELVHDSGKYPKVARLLGVGDDAGK